MIKYHTHHQLLTMSNQLLSALHQKRWAEATTLLQTEAGRTLAHSKDANLYFPLHIVLKEKGPGSLVIALCRAFEDAAKSPFPGAVILIDEVEYLSSFPIHIALANSYSFDVISVLVNSVKDGAKFSGKMIFPNTGIEYDNILPLHLALRTGADYTVIEMLLSRCRNAVSLSAQDSRCYDVLPIHYAIQHGARLSVIVALLLCYPQSLDSHSYNTLTRNMMNYYLEPLTILALKQPIAYWARYSFKLEQVTFARLDDVVREVITDLEESTRYSTCSTSKCRLETFRREIKLSTDTINLSLSEMLVEMKTLNSRMNLIEAYVSMDQNKSDGSLRKQPSQEGEVARVQDELNQFKVEISTKITNLEALLTGLDFTVKGHGD